MCPVWRRKIAIRNIWSHPYMLWLWCLVPLLTLFQLYRGDLFFLWFFFFFVKETRVHRESESDRPVASHWTLSHNVVSSTPHHERNSNCTNRIRHGYGYFLLKYLYPSQEWYRSCVCVLSISILRLFLRLYLRRSEIHAFYNSVSIFCQIYYSHSFNLYLISIAYPTSSAR